MINAIGGYFELELPVENNFLHAEAKCYQSARAAFMALLKNIKNVKRVWMPIYICDAMLAPVRAAGKEILFYTIDNNFAINKYIYLKPDDLLFYVNYFGVNARNVSNVLTEYNPAQVVIDCSQALYSGPYDCLATIYSPRKFLGVPDGGLLITQKVFQLPIEQDEESIFRTDHLLKRIAFSAEAGYESSKKSEASLQNIKPKRMSYLTKRLLASIDHNVIINKRKANFIALHNALGESNLILFNEINDAAMCYPYLPRKKINKKTLAEKSIFIPTYWSDVITRSISGSFEQVAANEMLAIPCDQRISNNEINYILELIRGFPYE